jgi:flagellum-specific peptidoglycan hydrolase FlgJ
MTDEERIEQELRIRDAVLAIQIKKEIELFHLHLDKVGAPCFVQDFFNKVMYEAIDSKSLPSVAIAQASVETGYGRYNKLQNNIFGIKGRGIRTVTKEYYKGKFITIRANFQYFPTLKDAFNKHSEILYRYGARGYDYENWLERIKACGYATDPLYSHKVRSVIKRYELHRLDKIQILKKKMGVKKVEICNPNFDFIV